jgi:predicted nuclease of predicted toxin-antitoxin system
VKILLDHNLDWRLARALPEHEVRSTLQMGWDALMNGVLLTEAEQEGFQVMLTADKSIKTQQSIGGRAISLIVLRAPNNQRKTHLLMMSEVYEILLTIQPGEVVEVFHELFRNKTN